MLLGLFQLPTSFQWGRVVMVQFLILIPHWPSACIGCDNSLEGPQFKIFFDQDTVIKAV